MAAKASLDWAKGLLPPSTQTGETLRRKTTPQAPRTPLLPRELKEDTPTEHAAALFCLHVARHLPSYCEASRGSTVVLPWPVLAAARQVLSTSRRHPCPQRKKAFPTTTTPTKEQQP